MKRIFIFSVTALVCVHILTSCHKRAGEIKQQVNIPEIKSASAIVAENGKFYIAGKISRFIYVLDGSFAVTDSIPISSEIASDLANGIDKRISGLCFTRTQKGNRLLAIENGYKPGSDSAYLIEPETKTVFPFSLTGFYNRFRDLKIENRVNFEGICSYGNSFILTNRGNLNFRKNYLVAVPHNFYQKQDSAIFQLSKVGFNTDTSVFMGISSPAYSFSSDCLLLVVNPEIKPQDKAGSSKIWIISNFSGMSGMSAINANRIIDLEAINTQFKNREITGLCIQHEDKKKYQIVLAAADSAGTTLFKLDLYKQAAK